MNSTHAPSGAATAATRVARTALSAACLMTMSVVASAAVVFSPGTGGNAGTDNVLFGSCNSSSVTGNPVVGSGMTVSGCLNSSRTTFVEFAGIEALATNGGQALVQAAFGSFSFLTVSLEDDALGFNKFIFNVNTLLGDFGDITITANLFGGTMSSTTFSVGNGSNFFNVTTNAGEVIQSVTFASTVGLNPVEFQDARQFRLGITAAPGINTCPPGFTGTPPGCIPDETGNSVPAPGTLALIGVAFLAAGVARRVRAVPTP